MRDHYDFSNAVRNPYAQRMKGTQPTPDAPRSRPSLWARIMAWLRSWAA